MKTEPRAEALAILYAADATSPDEGDTTDASRRATLLVDGVREHAEEIDEAIEEASDSWRIDRMAVVDRNILRIAAFELMFTDLSMAIIISEAVGLGKEYSTSASGAFINGLLSALAKSHREDGADIS